MNFIAETKFGVQMLPVLFAYLYIPNYVRYKVATQSILIKKFNGSGNYTLLDTLFATLLIFALCLIFLYNNQTVTIITHLPISTTLHYIKLFYIFSPLFLSQKITLGRINT